MLFMVYHKHTAEMCPGGKVQPDKDFISKLNDQIQESGVELVGGYIDGPGHRFYMVIETDDSSKLNMAIEQLRLTGAIRRPSIEVIGWVVLAVDDALTVRHPLCSKLGGGLEAQSAERAAVEL